MIAQRKETAKVAFNNAVNDGEDANALYMNGTAGQRHEGSRTGSVGKHGN